MEVNLAHGRVIYTGSGIPPDVSSEGYVREEDIDSSDEAEDEADRKRCGSTKHKESKPTSPCGATKKTRRERKEEERVRKEEEKDERIARKMQQHKKKIDERNAREEHWKLIVTYRP